MNKRKNPTAHAEIVCIEKLDEGRGEEHFRDAVVYVNCEPCIMCASALAQLKVRKFYWMSKFYDCMDKYILLAICE